jgi:hypothetical protein
LSRIVKEKDDVPHFCRVCGINPFLAGSDVEEGEQSQYNTYKVKILPNNDRRKKR